MRRFTMALALAGLTAAPAALSGQQAVSTPDLERELRAMVTTPSPAEGDRRTVDDFLLREDVRTVAEEHGIDLDRLRAATATLDDEAAAELARQVRAADDQPVQVGGDTFVVSSTFIIIALLVAILIIVA